jgi:hypothetical protein
MKSQCALRTNFTYDGKLSIKVRDVQFQFHLIPNHTGPMSIHPKFIPQSEYNEPTNALLYNKTLIKNVTLKTLKSTPICFDQQLIIIRELICS